MRVSASFGVCFGVVLSVAAFCSARAAPASPNACALIGQSAAETLFGGHLEVGVPSGLPVVGGGTANCAFQANGVAVVTIQLQYGTIVTTIGAVELVKMTAPAKQGFDVVPGVGDLTMIFAKGGDGGIVFCTQDKFVSVTVSGSKNSALRPAMIETAKGILAKP